MTQRTLLKGISAPTTAGVWTYMGSAGSVTIQGSPQGGQHFSGTICIDIAAVPNPRELYFPIVTFNASPWLQFALLTFSAHQSPLAFTLALPETYSWIRARPIEMGLGSLNIYVAY